MLVSLLEWVILFAQFLDTVNRVYFQAASVLKQLQAFNEILKVTSENKLKLEKKELRNKLVWFFFENFDEISRQF